MKVTIDLIGRDMVKPEAGSSDLIQIQPILSCRLKHGKSANNISLHKCIGTINRTVDMTFSCQMHNHIGLMTPQHAVNFQSIANIDLLKMVSI